MFKTWTSEVPGTEVWADAPDPETLTAEATWTEVLVCVAVTTEVEVLFKEEEGANSEALGSSSRVRVVGIEVSFIVSSLVSETPFNL